MYQLASEAFKRGGTGTRWAGPFGPHDDNLVVECIARHVERATCNRQRPQARQWLARLRERATRCLTEELPGRRRSADRARLRANSLLTGNLTGKIAFLGLRVTIPEP